MALGMSYLGYDPRGVAEGGRMLWKGFDSVNRWVDDRVESLGIPPEAADAALAVVPVGKIMKAPSAVLRGYRAVRGLPIMGRRVAASHRVADSVHALREFRKTTTLRGAARNSAERKLLKAVGDAKTAQLAAPSRADVARKLDHMVTGAGIRQGLWQYGFRRPASEIARGAKWGWQNNAVENSIVRNVVSRATGAVAGGFAGLANSLAPSSMTYSQLLRAWLFDQGLPAGSVERLMGAGRAVGAAAGITAVPYLYRGGQEVAHAAGVVAGPVMDYLSSVPGEVAAYVTSQDRRVQNDRERTKELEQSNRKAREAAEAEFAKAVAADMSDQKAYRTYVANFLGQVAAMKKAGYAIDEGQYRQAQQRVADSRFADEAIAGNRAAFVERLVRMGEPPDLAEEAAKENFDSLPRFGQVVGGLEGGR